MFHAFTWPFSCMCFCGINKKNRSKMPPLLQIKKRIAISYFYEPLKHITLSSWVTIGGFANFLWSSYISASSFLNGHEDFIPLTNEMPLTFCPRMLQSIVQWNYSATTMCSIKQWTTAAWVTVCDSNEAQGKRESSKTWSNWRLYVTFKCWQSEHWPVESRTIFRRWRRWGRRR